MKEGWEYKRFEDALEKVKYTKKLQTNEFLSEGRVPIISQEEDYISGFWNNPDDAYKVEKPIVIFGDHSRVIKYVDFDFVLGADGVKILKPIESLNAKFLYHYLKWYNVPNMGYSRHYKFLKEINMPVPPLKEQQQIVSELDLLSGVIEKQKAQLEELDKLAQSIFYNMFGDPVTNERGWIKSSIEEISVLRSGNSEANNSMPGKLPYVKVGDMNIEGNEFYIKTSSTFIDKESNLKDIFPIGTTIFPKRGGAILTNKKRLTKLEICCDLNVMGVIPKKELIDPLFLYFYFLRIDFKIFAKTGSAIPQINNYNIAPMSIGLPPLSLQQEFAAKIEAIEAMKAKVRQSLKEAETLFNERMDYYFN